MPLLIQVLVPLVVAGAIGFGPRRSRATWWTQVALATALVGLLAVAGLWLPLPWFTTAVLAGLFGLALAAPRLSGRVVPGWPQGRKGRVGLVLQAAAALALGWTALDARLAGARPPDGAPVLDLAFPLDGGDFLVVAGGFSELLNPHLLTLTHPRADAFRGQSYAVDIVAIGAWGSRRRGLRPRDPSAYAIWHAAVVAPCPGVVVRAEGDEPDHAALEPVGAPDEGNHVTLRCGEYEVVLAHLARGTVVVAPGDRVTVGARLGLVGNSGSSDEPHLHIHAQRPGTALAPLSGEPVPIRFEGVVPVRNQRFQSR